MNDDSAKPGPTVEAAKPRSRWRRWVRRIVVVGIALLMLAGIGFFTFRTVFLSTGNRDLQEVTARLDRDDPDWRLDKLMAIREQNAPTNAKNSVLVVDQVHALIPAGWQVYWKRPQPLDLRTIPLNRQVPEEELLIGPHDDLNWLLMTVEAKKEFKSGEPVEIGDLVETTEKARVLGRSLRRFPQGYRPVTVHAIPTLTPLEGTLRARVVAGLMADDGLLAAHNGEIKEGLQAAHAALNAGRSIGDEPAQISQIVRSACRSSSAAISMRVLGLNDLKEVPPEMVELQTAMLQGAEEPLFLMALRGERAIWHVSLEALTSGRIDKYRLFRLDSPLKPDIADHLEDWFSRGYYPSGHAKYLELITRAIEAAQLPTQDQTRAMLDIENELRVESSTTVGRSKYVLTRLALPALDKLADRLLTSRAELVTAAAALACERFRISRGRWPESLEELPRDLLAAIPIDPFNGKPITLHKVKNGIAVVSVGTQVKPVNWNPPPPGPLGGTEIGWQLFDPKERGLLPVERVVPKKDAFEP